MKTLTFQSAVLTLAVLPCLLTPLRASVVTFSFDSDRFHKPTEFTDTVNGLSATFSSSGDPGGFWIMPSFFQTMNGRVLMGPGPADANNLALSIVFSTPLTGIWMNFATNSALGTPLILSAFNGVESVGASSSSGTIPDGFHFPEGIISFAGASFDRVVLSSTAVNFAIDNVTVTHSPEPGAFLLCAGALGGLFLVRRRAATGSWRRGGATAIHPVRKLANRARVRQGCAPSSFD